MERTDVIKIIKDGHVSRVADELGKLQSCLEMTVISLTFWTRLQGLHQMITPIQSAGLPLGFGSTPCRYGKGVRDRNEVG